MVNQKLKKDLLKKLGIAHSTLYGRAAAIKDELDMETEEAVYLLALQAKLKLKKYLDPSTIKDIRNLQVQWTTVTRNSTRTTQPVNASKKKYVHPKVLKFPSGFKVNDPLLEEHVKSEALQMASVYPYLYVLENSVRAFICLAMEKYHGKNWWNKQVHPKLQKKVNGMKKRENKNAWHQRRSARNIDYLDFIELKSLINKLKAQLANDQIIPNEEWVNNLITEVYESRNVIAHMNPLSQNNINAVKVRFNHWAELVKDKQEQVRP
jgi:hypothetical protein